MQHSSPDSLHTTQLIKNFTVRSIANPIIINGFIKMYIHVYINLYILKYGPAELIWASVNIGSINK